MSSDINWDRATYFVIWNMKFSYNEEMVKITIVKSLQAFPNCRNNRIGRRISQKGQERGRDNSYNPPFLL